MNTENVKAAIEIMRQAKSLDMTEWQTHDGVPICETEESTACTLDELHSCGNSACFAGYIAVSPQFRLSGGGVGLVGEPVFRDMRSAQAIAEWLDISPGWARLLVYGHIESDDSYDEDYNYCSFYEKRFEEVEPADVIAKLELILAGELA